MEEEIRLAAKGIQPDRSSYPKSLKRTKELLKEYEQHSKTWITFDQITLEFYYSFIAYMTEIQGYKINSMGKYIKYVKSIMKTSHAEGLHNNKAYSHPKFKILEEEVDTIYLDVDDLNLLESLNLEGFPGLVRARDLFLLASWTGLRFSDLQILTIDHLHGDNIVIKTQKTDKEVVIPVFPIVRNVLVKYKDTGLPSITNQALNRSLKDLGAKLEAASNLKGITADVSKYNRITTHTARRSFATNLYNIVPIELIMSVTGHKTQTEFYKYIRVTPKENADKLRQYFPSLLSNDKVGSV
jgi:integrase